MTQTMYIGGLGVITMIGIGMLIRHMRTAGVAGGWVEIGLCAIWLSMLAKAWHFNLTMPYKVTMRDGGPVEFIAISGTRRIAPHDIIAVEVPALNYGVLRIKHRLGRIYMINHGDRLHEWLAILKVRNPSLITRGW
jgi:hypothetical protein